LDNQISIMRTTLPTEKELQTAKNRIKHQEYSKQDTAEGVAVDCLYQQFYGRQIPKEYLDAVDKVSAEEVKAMAELVFNNNEYLVVGKSD